MDNVKASVERLGGTMSDFLYFQVFFCLRSDDSTPLPTGSAAAAAYQQGYVDLNSVYNTYWQGTEVRRAAAVVFRARVDSRELAD